jgi:hypothetical protein
MVADMLFAFITLNVVSKERSSMLLTNVVMA